MAPEKGADEGAKKLGEAQASGVKLGLSHFTSDPRSNIHLDTIGEYLTPPVDTIPYDTFTCYNNNLVKECLPCCYYEAYPDCPGSHKNQCHHNDECRLGVCECEKLTRLTDFHNLSKETIKRRRRQQIETPVSDFGLQKARAATRQKIKDSMRPFENQDNMTYKPIPATDLFEEFLNMLRGNFKRDMLEYIVREAKVLPIIDIDFEKEGRTYSKAELDTFTKQIGFDPSNINLDQLIAQCHNFILNEPIINCNPPIMERDLPGKALDIDITQQSQDIDYVKNIDLQQEIDGSRTKEDLEKPMINAHFKKGTYESPEAICARYATLEYNQIERCELILRTSSDRLTANFCCNDSGSNIQLISLQTLVAMGGEKKRINKVKSSIENSSGHNTLVIGEIEIELFAIQETTLLFLGKHNFVVIDNPNFKEILLGMGFLGYMRQELRRDPITKGTFYGMTCPKGKLGQYLYISNCPNERVVQSCKDKALKAKNKATVKLTIPLSVAEYVFCSEEIKHTTLWHNTIKIDPKSSYKDLSYKHITKSIAINIKPCESFTLKRGEDLPNMLGFPNHFDCGCRNDQDDIYLESTCFYTEQDGPIYKGHGVIEESLPDMNLKIGIDIDEIAKQSGEDEVLNHLDAEVRQTIRDINKRHIGAFNTPENPIGLFNGKKFQIEFEPGSSFYQPPLKLKGERATALDNQIKKLLKAGVIEKASGAGDCNIPAFAVGKVKGRPLLAQTLGKQQKSYDSYRLVLDMRLANSKMIGHGGVLLPSQDDLLTRMQCAKFVAVADISSAFHALEYDKETASKMRISHRGTHYIFKRVIMGALPSSQMLEQAVLMMFNQNDFAIFLKDKSCNENLVLEDLLLVYCDDLILGAPTIEQFYLIYEFVLQQISIYGMKLELKKLKILQPKTTILGYDFERTKDGIMTHCIKQAKIDQFLGLPAPASKRMLSSYLSSSAIYFKNIIGVKLIMAPLYLFLRSDSNKFEFCHFRALSILRLMMSLNLKQACMDPTKILVLMSDASLTATHGLVTQFTDGNDNLNLKPIMCSSKLFDKAGARQPSIYKECAGVISIVKQAEHLIRANKTGTFIVSDCRPLALGLRARSTTIGLAEAAIYLSSLPNLRILHLRGSEIRTCDVYSRLFSFGLASKEKFDKNQAMIFKSEFFGDMSYSISDLEKVIQKHENASYLKISPIKPGKITTSDFYAKILESDSETQYFRGLFKGYGSINKYHSFWRPGIKNEARDFITEAEFLSFVESGTFKEFREQLNARKISDNQVFYTIEKQGLVESNNECPVLFISKGYDIYLKRTGDKITIQISLPHCPPHCHLKPVPGPQIFLHSNFGNLKSTNKGFKLVTTISEYQGCHGFYDTLTKCDYQHEMPKVWTLEIINCLDLPLRVKRIDHFSIPVEQGARLISSRVIKCLCTKFSMKPEPLNKSNILSNNCQLTDDMICCLNKNNKNIITKQITEKQKESDKNIQREVSCEINDAAVMSLLMIAQASHFGPQHFSNFLIEMQQGSPPIKAIIDKLKLERTDEQTTFYHKRHGFLLDKKGLLWVTDGDKPACRLVAPSWFLSIMIKNLHSGQIHLSTKGAGELLNRTFFMIDEELMTKKLSKNPFDLPKDQKKFLEKLCIAAEKQCIKCIIANPSKVRSAHGQKRHLETSKPGAIMSFDLLEGLPRTPNNYTTIMIAVCRASNFIIALPQKSTSSSETLRNFEAIYSIIGPGLIGVETDGGSAFTKVSEFCCARGILHKRYGPRSETQGLGENAVKMSRHMISNAVFDIDIERRNLWDTILPEINHTINNLIVKPGLQSYTRRELFCNAFSNSVEHSSIHIQNIYNSLEKLKGHREATIRKLANLTSIPEVKINDLVAIKRKKGEIQPQKGTRAFIPPTGAQIYRVVGISPLFCRINSVLDNSFRTVSRTKIARLDVNEWIEANNVVPGLLRTIYQTHRFIPGFSTRPSFEKLKKNGIIDGEQIDDHIKNCPGNSDCHLLRDIPIGIINEDDLEDDWDTQYGPQEVVNTEASNDLPDQSEAESQLGQLGAEDQSEATQTSDTPLPPQLSVMTPDDDSEFRRVTRSMTKSQNSFYQALSHQAIPQSSVLTTVFLSRLRPEQQKKSILNKLKKNRLRKNISFAEHCLITEFAACSGASWVSTLHRMM